MNLTCELGRHAARALKPYPAYKDSRIEWLEEVPEHWKTERAKWLFRKMEQPVRENDEVVACFRDGVVTLRKNRRVRGFTESLKEIGYQGVRRGDLVIGYIRVFKWRKYLISLSFRGQSSVRPVQVGGFDVNIVIHRSTAVRGRGGPARHDAWPPSLGAILAHTDGPALWKLIGIGGRLTAPPLPHHRAYGSVPRRFGRVSGHGLSRRGSPSESK